MIERSPVEYLLINTLHSRITRSLGKIVLIMSETAVDIFFFLCSKVKEAALSLITRPVRLGLYSLHSSMDFTKTMHWIRNCSKDTIVASGFVIMFKLKSIMAGRTVWSPNEYGCLACKTTKVFTNLEHDLLVKSHNWTCLSRKAGSEINVMIRIKRKYLIFSKYFGCINQLYSMLKKILKKWLGCQ